MMKLSHQHLEFPTFFHLSPLSIESILPTPTIYSKDEWAKITEKLKTLPFTQANARKFTRFLLSGAIEAELDKSGRVGITSHLIEYKFHFLVYLILQ